MANFYVNFGDGSTTGYYAVAMWTTVTAYVSTSNGGRGDYVRQRVAPAVGSERVWRCTTSGTSLVSEPTWTLTKNSTTTETAGPVWTECTGQEADQVSGTWKAPAARLNLATSTSWCPNGTVVYVGDNHAETQATQINYTITGTSAIPTYLYCVLATGTVPPVSADLRATATVTTTGGNSLLLNGPGAYFRGIIFKGGSGAVTNAPNIAGSGHNSMVFDTCSIRKVGTSAGALIFGVSGAGNRCRVDLINTTLSYGNTGDWTEARFVDFRWSNTSSAITGATIPTTLFDMLSNNVSTVYVEGVDLSAVNSGGTLVGTSAAPTGKYIFKDCKIGGSVTVAGTPASQGGAETYVVRSDSGGSNNRAEKYQYAGTSKISTAMVRTGGASDGITAIGWQLVTTANSTPIFPLEAFPIAIWNPTYPSTDVTVTLEGIWSSTVVPTNAEIWFDVEYMGSASSPAGSFKTCGIADGLTAATNLTASTQAWDSMGSARQNSNSVSLGAIRKVASNAGRQFICTTAGTTASSEPGGYATAVDGGSVTDGGAVFRAMVRFKFSVTLTSPQPKLPGALYAYVKAAKVSTTFYIDPLIVLS